MDGAVRRPESANTVATEDIQAYVKDMLPNGGFPGNCFPGGSVWGNSTRRNRVLRASGGFKKAGSGVKAGGQDGKARPDRFLRKISLIGTLSKPNSERMAFIR